MSAKIDRLVKDVVTTVNNVGVDDVKSFIGDSTTNNRVPTVSQVIRFLSATNYTLSADLRRVYRRLQANNAFKRFRRGTNRTDAIDINELITVVTNAKTTTRRELGERIFYV